MLPTAVAAKARPATLWLTSKPALPRNETLPPRKSMIPTGLIRLETAVEAAVE